MTRSTKSATRTRPTRAETRQRILDAAIEVFGERGIAASSVSDVAAAAGMTKGAVYSNFTGKDELVLTLMEEHAMQRLTAALARFAEADDPRTAIGNVGAVLIDAIRTDAVWHRLLAEYFALSHHDPRTREQLRDRRREARDAVTRALERVSDNAGVPLPLPAPQLAVVFFALSNGLGIESGIDPDAVPDDLLGNVLALITRDFVAALGRQDE
ncbi:TetR family transcriptional regulator [Herbihabitans rhizosphaerae]|uniref:TetR family transcriptional regulator n=2 Tax=Herbihabitans rhizosphaerae TaxID=1872711 RepID=A0A4Q7KMW6_9PSEU|nr:TetR family transcriptional regulator [Herbihabitans rhizosphaerae]